MASKLDYFKLKLEEEREKLERQLSSIARRNPESPSDWEPTSPRMDTMVSDQTELADVFEELEIRVGSEAEIEARLNQVKAALKRIEKGVYGKCSVGGENIDEERLEANPAAETCVKHGAVISR